MILPLPGVLRNLTLTITGAMLLASAVALPAQQAPGGPAPKPDPKSPAPVPAPKPDPKSPAPAPATQAATPAKPADPPKPAPKPGTPKPYKDVITAEAKSDKGMFTVHRIDERVLFEIPTALYDRDMLWQTEIAATGAGAGYGGTPVGSKVVRWSRRNNTVYLRSVSYAIRADGKSAVQRAVDSANVMPILASFPVEAEGEKSAVIDATRLYAADGGPVPAGPALGGGADGSRSYLDRIKSFPANIEARSVITYQRPAGPITTTIHSSLALLPDHIMQGRLFDSRVGYFGESFSDYGSTEHRVKDITLVARYRLEKKNPTAKLSDPVKPIVYYVSREVPEKWRPFVKQAIEDWRPCFEQAGFSNAIIAKDAPTEQEDPNWDPEDARYSVIRWAAQPVMNAMGPHVADTRSGEILSAHVIIWHNVLKLAEQWYFVQCADLDPRARSLPLPDELMGQLVRFVVAHEVGHTLGLRHNHKASSSYTAAQLRSREFTEKMGDEASIMDYGRFNYVAQPGDNARLIPGIGPYDRFAIEWGYKPIPGALTPEAEKSELDLIAGRQATNPVLRFGGEDDVSTVDPTVQTEDLGSDPIEATTLGLKNIDRIVPLLIPATAKFGEDYDLLTEMYAALLGQRQRELAHVLKLVGGVVETRYHVGRGGEVFQPVPPAKQAAAVRFLIDNAFATPTSLLAPEILGRIEYGGVTDRVLASQMALLNGLLAESRLHRLMDREAESPSSAYTVAQLMTDLQHGVWSELGQASPRVDLYRRNLQRGYLASMQTRLVGASGQSGEFRPTATGALQVLRREIAFALPRVKDLPTQLHLRDAQAQIENILNPKFAPQSASGPQLILLGLGAEQNLPEARSPEYGCALIAPDTDLAREAAQEGGKGSVAR